MQIGKLWDPDGMYHASTIQWLSCCVNIFHFMLKIHWYFSKTMIQVTGKYFATAKYLSNVFTVYIILL